MSISDFSSIASSSANPSPASKSPGESDGPSGSGPAFAAALVVVDMQNDFVYGSLPVPGAISIIDKVNAAIDMPFRIRIATRDFHPDNHVSFAETHRKPTYSRTTIYHPEDIDLVRGMEQTLWPIHCVAYTGGADFVPGLKTTKFDAVIHKGTHPNIESYSAFRDIWHKGTTELPEKLEINGITDVFFVGLAGDYCVKYTAVDAVDFGYNSWIVSDAVKSISEDEMAWNEMKAKGVKFLSLDELRIKLDVENIV